MPLTPEDRHRENLAQAQWRVNFRQSLLQTHQGSPTAGEAWKKREQELLNDLEDAMRELHKLEKEGK
ncbi:MAG: hypothetical protein ACAH88_06930 [Roseimicrobium sp.]